MTDIVKRQPASVKDEIEEWSHFPEDARRRAMTAARDKDITTLWSLTRAHMLKKKRTTSEHTLTAYRRNIVKLLGAWPHVNLLRPGRNDGDTYAALLEASGLKAASVQQSLSAARALYAALRWVEATDAHPFRDVSPESDPVKPEDKRQAYSLKALKKLYATARDGDPLDLLMVLLGGRAGLRVSEMTGRRVTDDETKEVRAVEGGVRWGDINLVDAALIVRKGKGNKQRTVPLHGDVVDALKRLEPGDPHNLVFRGMTPHALRYRMRQLCDRAGVNYLGLHSLRHAFATQLRAGGAHTADIAQDLGQTSEASSKIYAKMDRSQQRTRVGSLPPLTS